MGHEKKALGKSFLIKFNDDITKDEVKELDKLCQEVEELDPEYKVFIIDLSKVSKVDSPCLRPFIYLQSVIRKRSVSFLLILEPKQPLKENLLSIGGVRSDELCRDRLQIAHILKKRPTSEQTCPKGILKVS